ncbi:putative adenylate kinase 1 chloroplastic [Prunus yedoensis var. nudiflora]|uniref:Putative adenylate kinase 1 chloroplastic n=1 Tax=Prunus yedoensis var. nudiflora TaxID=2094558 RepID=A0A314ZSM0_PRUYE|nr:putative adenylate kinase 1 chloroplastic [Prunus yedoensis var. nudiflora]
MTEALPPIINSPFFLLRIDASETVLLGMLFVTSQPVEGFYRSRGKLLEFDLPGGIPESWPKLLQALNLEDHEDKQSAAA